MSSSINNPNIKPTEEASIFTQPWGTTWRKAIVSIPRLVPDIALKVTSPDGPHPFMAKIPSRGKHLIPVYIFIPPNLSSEQKVNLPILLDFHGGGFVLGSCQEQAPFCAKLSRELSCITITVDYRLGPYSQFPAALDDSEDILSAILDTSHPGYTVLRQAINRSPNIEIDMDKSHLALSGFSSGGNIALNLVLTIPATPPHLTQPHPTLIPATHHHQIPTLLFYPSLDARQLPHERPLPHGLPPSTGLLASLNLESELMPTYLPRNLAGHPRASPGLVPVTSETLHTSARIMLVLPELDSLAEQSRIWVETVRGSERARDLSVRSVRGVVHGWTQFPDGMLDDRARREKGVVFDEAVDFVRRAWEGV